MGCGAQPGLPMPARAQRALRARCVRARLPGADSESLSAAVCTAPVADLRWLRPGSGLGQGRAQREGPREGRDQGVRVCVCVCRGGAPGTTWGKVGRHPTVAGTAISFLTEGRLELGAFRLTCGCCSTIGSLNS